MKFAELPVAGCYLIETDIRLDERGLFNKNFHRSTFEKSPIRKKLEFTEDFYSWSKRGVLRGLHYQKPPHHHDKLVICLVGEILDVGLDLRKSSPTYGKHFAVSLSQQNQSMIFMPAGIAHGFYVPERGAESTRLGTEFNEALVYYKVTREYAPESDAGILWNSAQINWSAKNPLLSSRDQNFPALQDLTEQLDFSYQSS